MGRHVVVGKGPVGSAVAEELVRGGHEVVVLSRSGGRSTAQVRHVAVDAADGTALAGAAKGAEVLYNAVNPKDYTRWAREWPPIAAALLRAAEESGAVLAVTGNLYGYPRPSRPMTATDPYDTTEAKGALRAAMWRDALAAQEAGRVRGVVDVRASDFVGAVPPAQSHLARQVETLRRGRRAWVVGDPDALHSWTYVPDLARALVHLGADERAWGRAWMVPSGEPRSQRQALTDVAAAMGLPAPKVSGMPWPALRAVGLVSGQMREIVAIRHQWDADFVLDATETTEVFGLTATPWAQAVRATVEGVATASGSDGVRV
ncbi:NAD-dependent epimerase/dehydratase family protein [uncultured Pseudokineococcus sp.]|uniref:NAD-dependent epimerase/dehydratase family protein n=1 Tax=uncultured Pseudokineococcus sp. TaxID=1642928 RepID=UPI00263121C0|nr:NAD-dependent epimerase/dehydratase family protein [uncultured Pseudokineococcus sp.]